MHKAIKRQFTLLTKYRDIEVCANGNDEKQLWNRIIHFVRMLTPLDFRQPSSQREFALGQRIGKLCGVWIYIPDDAIRNHINNAIKFLDEIAPMGYYFGQHKNDRNRYGFWRF